MKNKSYIVVIFVVILGIIVGVGYTGNQSTKNTQELSNIKTWAYQLQDADPHIIATSGFDLVVIDYSRDGSEEGRYSPEEIQKIKDKGVPIAYLSIGEAEDYRFYWDEGWNTSPPEWLGKENPEWKGNYAVKYWDDNWKSILHSYLDRIIEQGFSGVYLDKIDEFEYWADPTNSDDEYLPEEESAKRMIYLILDIANYSRSKANGEFYIIPQNGERILEYDDSTLLNIISGWSAEDLFYDGTEEWSNEDMEWISENRISYLDVVLSKGKPVFSVDYVDDGSGYTETNKKRIDDYREKCLSKGYMPYAALSDRELDELNIIEGVQPVGTVPYSSDLSNVIVYPNPFKPSKGHTKVTFKGLTMNSKIRIYNVAGELVYETNQISGGTFDWNCRNSYGKGIDSGIYIYLITDNRGRKAMGKMGVIR